jgi:uncharacterized membrane protein
MSQPPNGDKPPASQSNPPKPPMPTPVAEIIPPVLDTALRASGLNPEDPTVTKTVKISSALLIASGSLPLPPAPILAEYEEVFPGLVERIIGWTEEQRKHRQGLEQIRTDRSEARKDRGQTYTFQAACLGLLAAAAVGIFGNPYVGAVLAIVAIGGPTAATLLAGNSGLNIKRPATPSSPAPSSAPPSPP